MRIAVEHRDASESAPTIDVKMVLTAAVELDSVTDALQRLTPWRGRFQLILQPVTPHGQVTEPCPPELLERCATAAAEAGFAPRVLPQVHKMLGIA